MAFSTVEITFVSVPNVGDELVIGNDLVSPGGNIGETFQTLRQQFNESTIGSTEAESAFFYQQAVSLDYNSGGLYTITLFGATVTIEAVQDGVAFSEDTNTSSGRITTVITNEAATPALTIDTVAFSEADSDPCNNIKVTVTTSELATKVTSPVEVDPNVANPFIFDWVRAVEINIACETATLSVDEDHQLPDILSVASTTLTVVGTPTGAILTVTHTSSFLLDLEYQLENVTTSTTGAWQDSNIFTGLTDENYIVHIRDGFGCQIQKDFSVSQFTPDISVTVPEFSLSKSMSIRYKEDVTWADCSDYRNEENTLSCEYNVLLPHREVQQFQTCDLTPTQFRTNYETKTANVIKSDGTKDALTVVEVTNYLDKKDKRDATYYNINDTQTGIYFTTGNTYDYDTGIDNGDYELNGLLPEWGIVGNFIFLEGIGWFTIVDIIFNESADADVLVIDYVYAGIPASIIVSSNYNLFNYNVYEFNVDMNDYDEQEIQVEILITDTVFTNRRKLSEKIEVAERWEDTIKINYWNPTNTDVLYATGIKNTIRMEYQTFHPGIDPTIEGFDTDTNSILLNSQSYETNILVLSPVTVGVFRQIAQAFLHKELYLDDVQYRITEIETEPFGQTNLQVITATFKKSGNVFNSELEGADQSISGDELIGLLQSGGTYISLQ
jgi:hypothetical protein